MPGPPGHVPAASLGTAYCSTATPACAVASAPGGGPRTPVPLREAAEVARPFVEARPGSALGLGRGLRSYLRVVSEGTSRRPGLCLRSRKPAFRDHCVGEAGTHGSRLASGELVGARSAPGRPGHRRSCWNERGLRSQSPVLCVLAGKEEQTLAQGWQHRLPGRARPHQQGAASLRASRL